MTIIVLEKKITVHKASFLLTLRFFSVGNITDGFILKIIFYQRKELLFVHKASFLLFFFQHFGFFSVKISQMYLLLIYY